MITLPRIIMPPRIAKHAFQGASYGFATAVAAMGVYVIFAHLAGEPGPERAGDALGGMNNVTGINLFSDRLDTATGLSIITGAQYANVQAVMDAQSSHAWCYTAIGIRGEPASTHITLATQMENRSPEFFSLGEIPSSMLRGRSFSAASLEAAARRSCAFPSASTTAQQS